MNKSIIYVLSLLVFTSILSTYRTTLTFNESVTAANDVDDPSNPTGLTITDSSMQNIISTYISNENTYIAGLDAELLTNSAQEITDQADVDAKQLLLNSALSARSLAASNEQSAIDAEAVALGEVNDAINALQLLVDENPSIDPNDSTTWSVEYFEADADKNTADANYLRRNKIPQTHPLLLLIEFLNIIQQMLICHLLSQPHFQPLKIEALYSLIQN